MGVSCVVIILSLIIVAATPRREKGEMEEWEEGRRGRVGGRGRGDRGGTYSRGCENETP